MGVKCCSCSSCRAGARGCLVGQQLQGAGPARCCVCRVPGLLAQGSFLLLACPMSLLLSPCWVVAANMETGKCTLTPPAAAEQALPSVVSCKEHKAVLRMSGNAMRCDAEDMPVSPADPRFPLTFSTSYECLWWHWAVGTVPAQGSGSRGCHGPGTRGEKYRSYSVMCWQLSQIPVSQS